MALVRVSWVSLGGFRGRVQRALNGGRRNGFGFQAVLADVLGGVRQPQYQNRSKLPEKHPALRGLSRRPSARLD